MPNHLQPQIQDANAPRSPVDSDGTGRFLALARELSEVGKGFYERNWVLGTSGNFSAAISKDPIRLAITATGLDKGRLLPEQFLEIDESTNVLRGDGKPSAETLLHIEIVRERNAGAVLHTHSVWSTVLSGLYAAKGGISIEGYEMLKGLSGIQTHEHREWLPIIPNSQYMAPLSRVVSDTLKQYPAAHGFLLQEHGLYTWGADIDEARRHIEILEFLMETLVRRMNVGHAI
jgi:methylthioribulose-1-phosphate dehydratase